MSESARTTGSPASAAAVDAVTVARAQGGDRAALDQVLRALQEPLYAHVRGITRDDALAADVLQRVLLQLCRRLSSLRDPRWLRAWAWRIATREAVRATRRERAWRDMLMDPLAGDVETAATHASDADGVDDDTPFDEALVARVPSLVDALPPAAGLVLRMHYRDGLTLAEVAEALEVPRGTIKSRLAYGLAALRRELGVGAQESRSPRDG